MRVLIFSAAILAFASAAPSGALYAAHGLPLAHAAPYGVAHAAPYLAHAAPYAVAHAAPIALTHGPAAPTISPGDIQGAAIDAHVDAADHVRASVDQAREHHDQASEIHGQQVNAAEDHSWQALDAVKTVEAQLDGAAAGVAPIVAKSLAGPAVVAAPAVYGAHGYAAHGYAPAAYAAHGYAAHGYAAHAPLVHAPVAHSSSVVHQSLSQTHPAPLVHAPAIAYSAPHGVLAHGW